jgi:soluble lytic murein transglycosylase-like protein
MSTDNNTIEYIQIVDNENIIVEEIVIPEVVQPKIEIPEATQPKIEIVKDPYEEINSYVDDICTRYSNVGQALVKSVIFHESTYNPNTTNGDCVGLMQISMRWHKDRASKLGVTNFYDPYGNILLGVDYLSELMNQYKDIKLVLMLYNMNHDSAFKLYREGNISYYAKSVLSKAEQF